MKVCKIQKLSSCNQEAKMLAYRVPNELYWGRILHQSVPGYHWTIVCYLTEHELQKINLLLGCLAFGSGTSSPSLVKLHRGWALVFLPHVASSARNGAKLLSSDKVYIKFCLQFSNLLTVLLFERLHCFGARWVLAITVVVFRVYEWIRLGKWSPIKQKDITGIRG